MGTLGLRGIKAWGQQGSETGGSGALGLGDMGSGGCGTCHGSGPCPHSGCFREYFVHKFRAMLGKNRVIFPGEKVLGGGT